MVIDPSKVNLCEKDIEDYLFANPEYVGTDGWWMKRWVKRQYAVPSGIIDLLGLTYSNEYVVVEVKNVAIDSSALTQVSRYGFDIVNILQHCNRRRTEVKPSGFWPLHRMVIGKSIDAKTMLEAEALGIEVITFDIRLSLGMNPIGWKDEYVSERNAKWESLSSDDGILGGMMDYINSISNDDVPIELNDGECAKHDEV